GRTPTPVLRRPRPHPRGTGSPPRRGTLPAQTHPHLLCADRLPPRPGGTVDTPGPPGAAVPGRRHPVRHAARPAGPGTARTRSRTRTAPGGTGRPGNGGGLTVAQLFVASTFFGAMSLAAALDSGQFGPADQRRILLVSNNATAPEVVAPLDAAPGFETLRSRF